MVPFFRLVKRNSRTDRIKETRFFFNYNDHFVLKTGKPVRPSVIIGRNKIYS